MPHWYRLQGLEAIKGLQFRLVDGKGQVVGRLASQIAQVLMGKDKPTYNPSTDDGDGVIVINAKDVDFTGRKWDQKLYRWHTGYPGGLKERTAKEQHSRNPDAVLRAAVLGMLPKNNLRRSMARKLRIFPGSEHNLDGFVNVAPFRMPDRKIREKGDILVLSPGFEPLNPELYWKKYGSRLQKMKEKSS